MGDEYKVISADSHVYEPHDMWATYIDPAYRDRAPRLVREEHTDRLVCEEATFPPVGLLAGCSRRDDAVRPEGRWDEDVFRPGYDPDERLVEQKRDGVDAEIIYPTLGMQLYPIQDLGFLWAMLRAYNTWIAEFCSAHPTRLKSLGMLVLDEVEPAVAELKRCKELGHVGVMIPLWVGDDDAYWQPQYDALWAAAQDLGMPVSMHAATTRSPKKAWNKGTPTDFVLATTQVQRALGDMLFNGVFDRFPKLRVVSAENDAGWAGIFLERADYWVRRGRRLTKGDLPIKRLPSEIWRKQIKTTFMVDHSAVRARDVIGVETLMWGSDFPHNSSTWPESQKVIDSHFQNGDSGADRKRILVDNARELYGF